MSTTKANRANAEELLSLVMALAAAYRQEADKATQTAYLLGLSDIPLDKLRGTIIRAMQTEQFMPTVATLRRLAGFELSTKSRAVVAFDALGDAVTNQGAYRSVRFDDPILNATVQSLGGWVGICGTTLDDWDSHFRHRFMDAYQGNYEARRGTMYAQLGIAEIANNAASLPSPPPVLISVELPKVPGVGYEIPEKRQHLLRTDAKQLAHDIGRIEK